MNDMEAIIRNGLEGKFFVMIHGEYGPVVKTYSKPVEIGNPEHKPVQNHWRKPGPAAQPLSDEIKAKIRQLFESGTKSDEIQRIVRVGWNRLHPYIRELRAAGVKGYRPMPKQWSQEEIKRLQYMIAWKHSWREIAAAFPGRSESGCRNKAQVLRFVSKGSE